MKVIWKIRKVIADVLRKVANWFYPLGWHGLYFRGTPIISDEEPTTNKEREKGKKE